MTTLLVDALGSAVQSGIETVMSGIPDVVKTMLGGGGGGGGGSKKNDGEGASSVSSSMSDGSTTNDESEETADIDRGDGKDKEGKGKKTRRNLKKRLDIIKNNIKIYSGAIFF